jgi:hypothetical protein
MRPEGGGLKMIHPQIKLSTRHRISVMLLEVHICVDVDEYGSIELVSARSFGDITLNNPQVSMQEAHANRMEVFNYLTEFELATWRPIGPEDSEIFATKKLDPEFGIETDRL